MLFFLLLLFVKPFDTVPLSLNLLLCVDCKCSLVGFTGSHSIVHIADILHGLVKRPSEGVHKVIAPFKPPVEVINVEHLRLSKLLIEIKGLAIRLWLHLARPQFLANFLLVAILVQDLTVLFMLSGHIVHIC